MPVLLFLFHRIGQIRYMSGESTGRKFDSQKYIRQNLSANLFWCGTSSSKLEALANLPLEHYLCLSAAAASYQDS
jgi:hypothetical protein